MYYAHNLQIRDHGQCGCRCHKGSRYCDCGWRVHFPSRVAIHIVLRPGRLESRVKPFGRSYTNFMVNVTRRLYGH